MLKRIAALLTAGIFFLTPNFALAKKLVELPPQPPPDYQQPFEPAEIPEQKPIELPPQPPPDYQQPFEEVQPSEIQSPSEIQPPDGEIEGLEFLVYHQDGVMAFAVIADHEKYKLRPVLARGQVPGRATVSQMNSRNAIATINASYFGKNGTLYGNTKIDGLTAGTTEFIRSALGIRADGSTIFARQAYRGVLKFADKSIVVNGVDCERNQDTVVVYNVWQGWATGTNNFGLEIVVRGGVVTNIFRDKGNTRIPRDGFVVSAHGTAAQDFADVQVGDAMIFDEDYINVENGADFNEAVHIIGAGPTLVKNGEIYVTADAEQFPADIRVGRAPRSAVGVTKYGDYIFAVVDGRQAHSKGCTLTEWARILKFNFGAVNAINLDGGGSTELIFKGSLVNKPSDGTERPVGDGLSIVRK